MTEPLGELERLRRERDFYQRLLELGQKEELEPLLERALALMVEVSGGARGYIELRDEKEREFWTAAGIDDKEVEAIRSAISRGVIAEALATRKTIVTQSALDDIRFNDRGSVKRHRIEAVLCAPIGLDPPLGVLYLQGRGAGVFGDADRERVEAFAAHLAVFADRILARRARVLAADATAEVRKRLRASDAIVGRSPALASVLEQAAPVAQLDISVLLTGPAGTGKTLFARVLHDSSKRASQPFVALNCAAVPETLLESELFGSVPGAFHGAIKRDGLVAAAEGGTLFLDEIGELPLTSQAKLLTLLQSKEYYVLGSPKQRRANVRLIAATNLDLEAAVAKKTFREDLYFRLSVMPIAIPALAERREDIAPLAEAFCAKACDRHGFSRARLTPVALGALEASSWPGNVRELEHAVERAVIRAAGEGAREVLPVHVFPEMKPSAEKRPTFDEATRRFQAELLEKVLKEVDWNVSEAAKSLGLSRSHVYNLIEAFGLKRAK